MFLRNPLRLILSLPLCMSDELPFEPAHFYRPLETAFSLLAADDTSMCGI